MIKVFLNISNTFFVLAIFCVNTGLSQQSTFVAAVLQETGENLEKLDKIINEHEILLEKYPKSEFAPTVMFQLAELHDRRSTMLFQNAMAEYEQNLAKFDTGELKEEPIMPRISLEKTIQYCYRIINDFPAVHFKDKVLYILAMAHLQEGNTQKALTFFEQIIKEFPNSDINLESHFRMGEHYFDKREFQNAIEQYRFLLGKWNNPYFDMALYKLGWSYYNLQDYSDAITTLIYLLEDISLIETTDSEYMGKTRADLRSEAIEYIASCYTEYGGPDAAMDFLKSRPDKFYSLPILLKIANLYQDRNYYAEALKAYEGLLELYPFYQDAPNIYDRIISCYELDERIDDANKVREKMVQQFGPGSPWTMKFPDGELFEKALEVAEDNLLYLGTYHQAEAQKKDRIRDYLIAIDKYKEFLEKFPYSEDAARINYYLAECYYEGADYKNAALAYYDVVARYDSSEYREEAAFNRVLCYYQLIRTDQPIDSVAVYIDEFLGGNAILIVTLSYQSEIDLLQSCNDFIRMFPTSEWRDQVLMKFGESLHELKDYKSAVNAYKKVVKGGSRNPYYLLAAMNAGQCYFDAGDFAQAEAWFSTLVENFPDSVRHIEKAQKLAALSKFKIAESLSLEGNSEESATMLQSVAEQTNDPQLRDRALFEASVQYKKNNQNTEAALILEQLAKVSPSSDLADEALYQAAGLRESKDEWRLAAADYLQLAENYPGSPYAARSLRNAAICYENTEDWFAAKRVYGRFAEQFPDTSDEVIECLFKKGEMSFKTGNYVSAREDFDQTLQKYHEFLRQGIYVDSYFAAQTQFMIGEILFEDYKKLELRPPLEASLQRKVNKFQQVFQAYKDALEFQIADWATAASFRIGMAFEEFVRAFMDAPSPPGLKGEELENYLEKLAETARPYKEQALQTYQRTVSQAEANHIENWWVDQSRKRMEVLWQELNGPPKQNVQTEEGTSSS